MLKWVFTTPLGCMLTFLGGLALIPLAYLALLGLWMLIAWSSSNAGLSPEKAFRRYIMSPIPAGVSHIRTTGEDNITGSDLVIMFNSDPALFPSILKTSDFKPCRNINKENYEMNYFQGCPAMGDAEYFEDLPAGEYLPNHVIKANRSRTRIYYAFTRN